MHQKRVAGFTIVAGLLLAINEIRGLILAIPVFAAMWHSGGSLMAIWLGICSLAGIALSVVVPLWVARRLTDSRKVN